MLHYVVLRTLSFEAGCIALAPQPVARGGHGLLTLSLTPAAPGTDVCPLLFSVQAVISKAAGDRLRVEDMGHCYCSLFPRKGISLESGCPCVATFVPSLVREEWVSMETLLLLIFASVL